MLDLGRVRFQVADDEIAIVLGTDIWWCSAFSMQHPLMEFLQYCQYSTVQHSVSTLHARPLVAFCICLVRVHLYVAPQGPSSKSRQSRRNLENTTPQVGHSFLYSSFGDLSCPKGPGNLSNRRGATPPAGVPGPLGQPRLQKQ